jgi:hypothetical protein
MGIFDFLLGRKSSGDALDGEIEKERKTYGDLYSGGAGRVNRDLDNSHAEKIEKNNPSLERKVSRLQDDLRGVERRTRDLHIYANPVKKKIGKVESLIGGVRDAGNSHVMSAKLRTGLKKSYSKIKEENDRHLEKLRHDGATDRHIRDEERKLDKIRKDMSSMYRRSGGSGMLK